MPDYQTYARKNQPRYDTQLEGLADDGLHANLGVDEVKSSLKTKDADSDEQSESRSTIKNLQSQKSPMKELLNNYKNKEFDQRSENMKGRTILDK